MKNKAVKEAPPEASSKLRVLEQLMAQTRIMRKANDLALVQEATDWEKRLRERAEQLSREPIAA